MLENDAEYQRWQIERRNALRTERDRGEQEARRLAREALRNKALSDLGPQAAGAPPAPVLAQNTAPAANPAAPSATRPVSVPSRRSPSRGFDLNIGSGPVGPWFLIGAGFAAWLARRLRKAA